MVRKLLKLMVMNLICIFAIISQYSNIFAETVDTAWVRRYNGPGNSEDYARAMAVDTCGNVYVTGVSHIYEISEGYTTIKYYPNGDTAWVRMYNNGEARGMTIDGSGNVYVTGGVGSTGEDWDYATIKYFPNGDTSWVRTYNGPGDYDDNATSIAVDDSSYVYVTGASMGSGTSLDYVTIKYSPDGDTSWVRRYNGSANGEDEASAIAVDSFRNVYVTGYSSNGIGVDYATIKYYTDGDTAWVRRYSGPGNNYNNYAINIAVDRWGNVYVSGYGTGFNTSQDYVTIKYSSNGDTIWVRRYNGPGNSEDYAWSLAIDSSGNVYVTGSSYNTITSMDYATIKYGANGDTSWIRIYNGSGNNQDEAFAIAVDNNENVYVSGYSYNNGKFEDYATIKYYPNGDTAWVRRYNGPKDTTDYAIALRVDFVGNVYVTGCSIGDGTGEDFATIKYKNVPVYSIMGKVMDDVGIPSRDSSVFLIGDRTAVDTTDSNGDYVFTGLPEGDYKVFRDSLLSMYVIHLTSDTSGFNFRGYSDINDIASQQSNPLSFSLSQNYPNPFNPSTKINFSLAKSGFVTLFIYDTLGRKVRTLISEQQTPGQKSVTWDGKNDGGKDVASGVYFYQLKVGDFSEPKKMLLLK